MNNNNININNQYGMEQKWNKKSPINFRSQQATNNFSNNLQQQHQQQQQFMMVGSKHQQQCL